MGSRSRSRSRLTDRPERRLRAASAVFPRDRFARHAHLGSGDSAGQGHREPHPSDAASSPRRESLPRALRPATEDAARARSPARIGGKLARRMRFGLGAGDRSPLSEVPGAHGADSTGGEANARGAQRAGPAQPEAGRQGCQGVPRHGILLSRRWRSAILSMGRAPIH